MCGLPSSILLGIEIYPDVVPPQSFHQIPLISNPPAYVHLHNDSATPCISTTSLSTPFADAFNVAEQEGDVTIVANGQEIKAHSLILQCRTRKSYGTSIFQETSNQETSESPE